MDPTITNLLLLTTALNFQQQRKLSSYLLPPTIITHSRINIHMLFTVREGNASEPKLLTLSEVSLVMMVPSKSQVMEGVGSPWATHTSRTVEWISTVSLDGVITRDTSVESRVIGGWVCVECRGHACLCRIVIQCGFNNSRGEWPAKTTQRSRHNSCMHKNKYYTQAHRSERASAQSATMPCSTKVHKNSTGTQ